jgi:hypothetical protein
MPGAKLAADLEDVSVRQEFLMIAVIVPSCHSNRSTNLPHPGIVENMILIRTRITGHALRSFC